jgi:mannose-6-phosphate isomerase
MDPILRLEGVVQHYAWGSRDAIPALLGVASPAPDPWAELWMGAHPTAPSRVEIDGAALALDRLIADRPREILGSAALARFGPHLPFLFKLLAADRPLSIQCHPDPVAAERGFQRENQLGIPLDARERNYRDASHKPELLCALGRFEALVGFRPPEEIRARLVAAQVSELGAEIDLLADGLEGFFRALMALAPERAERAVRQAATRLAGQATREAYWVIELARDFPRDPAVLAPLYLNWIELAAGQALYLGAGVLHAYLQGTGLELMASSDNVLRGGLTSKHVDLAELCRVVAFEPLEPVPLSPLARGAQSFAYPSPATEFELDLVALADAPCERAGGRPEIVLALGPRAELVAPGAQPLLLAQGQAALVTAATDRYLLTGRGRAYIATMPA